MDLVKRLVDSREIIIPTICNNEEFNFKYIKDKHEMFIIQALHQNKPIGVCQIKNGEANLPFNRKYQVDGENNVALGVLKEFRDKYSGIGTNLLSLAMGICKVDNYGEFKVVATNKSHKFYSKLGFEVKFTEDKDDFLNTDSPVRWYYSYNLRKELPKKDIIFLQ